MNRRTKRERNFAFLLLLLRLNKAQTRRSADTERKHRRTSITSHTYSLLRSETINCCFCCHSRRRSWKCQKKCFQKKFFRVSVLFCLPNCSVAIFASAGNQSLDKREKKDRKEILHDKSVIFSLDYWNWKRLTSGKNYTKKNWKKFSFEIFG